MRFRVSVLAIVLATGVHVSMVYADDFAGQRQRMVLRILELVDRLGPETGLTSLSPTTIGAMREVPRHEFVPPEERGNAYVDRPLSIGHAQTISQPFIVALMTDLLRLKPADRVLEVGTGTGYQAAVLARLAREVYTIEVIAPLAKEAQSAFQRLGISNIQSRIGDGYAGWPEAAPFDAIIVTAAPDHIPAQLVQQLKPGGRLVIPVGSLQQDLMVVEKKADGTTTSTEVIPVRFVPLTRERNGK